MNCVLIISLLSSGLVAGIGSPAAAADAQQAPQGTELVGADTPWSTFLVVGPTVRWQNGEASVWPLKGGGQLRVGRLVHDNFPPFDPAAADLDKFGFSPRPPADWMKPQSDVSAWSRYLQSDLTTFLSTHGWPEVSSQPELLCLRTRFGITDPAKATDLKLTVTCLGGAVVYVNGKEIGRGFMPEGTIHPLTPATDLPIEAYTLPDGVTPLNHQLHFTPENRPRWDRRIRSFTVDVPSSALVKGANVLAVELHRAAVAGPQPDSRFEWTHLSVHDVRLVSPSGAGAIAYAEAVRGTHLWSANPEQQIWAGVRQTLPHAYRPMGRNTQIRGIPQGNPFDPPLPIRIALPRNGVGSGQTVLTDSAGLRDVTARMGPLRGPQGELSPGTVEIRYAIPSPGIHFCDGLMREPPKEAKALPIWTIVQAPRRQPPGWYAGTLDITANDKSFSVPVQVLVTGAMLPDASDFTSPIGVAHSPDSVAGYYKVTPWSDEHFRLMEPAFRLLGQLGNDVLRVPVILGNMSAPQLGNRPNVKTTEWQPLVRWVKKGNTLTPEFSLLEKYLDAYLKHCAPPKAISFYVWDARSTRLMIGSHGSTGEGASLGFGVIGVRDGANLGKTTLRVLQWDPETGATTQVPAPEFEDEGAEAFWRPLLEGLRAVVKKRGWPERVIQLGLGGDLRPNPKTGELLRQWAPYARWHLLSHFSGDPAPKDGKMIATGKLEVGLMEQPYPRQRTAEALAQALSTTNEFIDLTALRWMWVEASPPFTYRHLPLDGDLGQLGLDFWLKVKESPQNSSYFGGIDSLTVPGPNGPEPTVRFQMLREGVQDMELRWAIVRALTKLPADQRRAHEELLDEHLRRARWSQWILSQFELQYDWRAYAARVQAAAADLAGSHCDAAWDNPPK